jgi:hypothetical protein
MSVSNCLDREHVGLRASEWNSVTGKWDNIYIAAIAGIESYPDQLYVISCEAHGEHTGARSLTTARILATDATTWCQHCKALSTVQA